MRRLVRRRDTRVLMGFSGLLCCCRVPWWSCSSPWFANGMLRIRNIGGPRRVQITLLSTHIFPHPHLHGMSVRPREINPLIGTRLQCGIADWISTSAQHGLSSNKSCCYSRCHVSNSGSDYTQVHLSGITRRIFQPYGVAIGSPERNGNTDEIIHVFAILRSFLSSREESAVSTHHSISPSVLV